MIYFRPRVLGTFAFHCPSVSRLGKRAYLYLPPREGVSDETPILFCWHHPELLILTKHGQVRRLKRSESFEREPPSSNWSAVASGHRQSAR
jgi:hypothetical protein